MVEIFAYHYKKTRSYLLPALFSFLRLTKTVLASNRIHFKTSAHRCQQNASLYTSALFSSSTTPSRASKAHSTSSYDHRRWGQLPSRNQTTMASTSNNNSDNLRPKTQQSPLASQRAKQSSTPSESNRTARFTGYFPLGYKEGFSQWVLT